METRKEHLAKMTDKQNVSIMKFEIQMLGSGLFTDSALALDNYKEMRKRDKEDETKS